MTDSERDDQRRQLVERLRGKADICASTLDMDTTGLGDLFNEAADEIEALNAECIRRMRDSSVSFNQAMANGEAALRTTHHHKDRNDDQGFDLEAFMAFVAGKPRGVAYSRHSQLCALAQFGYPNVIFPEQHGIPQAVYRAAVVSPFGDYTFGALSDRLSALSEGRG